MQCHTSARHVALEPPYERFFRIYLVHFMAQELRVSGKQGLYLRIYSVNTMLYLATTKSVGHHTQRT